MLYIIRPSCQRRSLIIIVMWFVVTGHSVSNYAVAEPQITLEEAEQIALENDALVQSITASADALRHQSIADGQLSDPKLKVGAMNLPVDSFGRGREPMTQLQIGVRQQFPRGRTLQYASRKTDAMADIEFTRARNQQLGVVRSVRKAYLDLYFQIRSDQILSEHERLFTQMLDITQRQYAVGRDNQHDILRAQLELSLLQDRLMEIHGIKDAAIVELSKWIGEDNATRLLPDKQPVLPAIPVLAALTEDLALHPLIRIQDHLIDVNRHQVAIAEEQYKPGWMLDVSYGERAGRNIDGSDRADFFSAMVLVDIPLFTNKRQDKRLIASRQRHLAAKFARTDQLRELKRQVGRMYARWRKLGTRFELYKSRTIIEAGQNAEATLKAYQSDVTEFTTLMRARLTELNTRLAMIRLQVDRAKVQTDLLYFAGDR